MWREASSKLEFVNTEKMNVYILQVMSILKQAYCSPKYLYYLLPGQENRFANRMGIRRKEILVQDPDEFESSWNNAVSALEHAIKLISHPQEFGVTSSDYLPYISILPAFASLQAHVKTLPSISSLMHKGKSAIGTGHLCLPIDILVQSNQLLPEIFLM